MLRSANGLEFRIKKMDEHLEARGIQREKTAPYTPEQNGRAERDNRTIIESARTMLFAKGLPVTLWAEAANTAVYLMNRARVRGDKTPYELWVKKKPNLEHLRIFGSEARARARAQAAHDEVRREVENNVVRRVRERIVELSDV